MEKEIWPAKIEFDSAWKEYFKNKPKPKTDDEEKKQLEEFNHWYNYIRKQSDTGKTPVEMYKETYGKEPSSIATENSRILNFEWDEDYKEYEYAMDLEKDSETRIHMALVKSLLKSQNSKKYENDVAYILEGREGVYYENKIYLQDFTFSTRDYKIREITDEELKELISSLIKLKSKVSKKDTDFFYFGMMYNKEDIYELSYNFLKGQKEEIGVIKTELPLSMKIKIYSSKKSVFLGNIKKGIGVVLRLKDKNILLEVSHDGGEIVTEYEWR